MTYDPFELVRCLHCNGTGNRNVEKKRTMLRRVCRECAGTGRVFQGNPMGHPYELVLDYCQDAHDCCRGKAA